MYAAGLRRREPCHGSATPVRVLVQQGLELVVHVDGLAVLDLCVGRSQESLLRQYASYDNGTPSVFGRFPIVSSRAWPVAGTGSHRIRKRIVVVAVCKHLSSEWHAYASFLQYRLVEFASEAGAPFYCDAILVDAVGRNLRVAVIGPRCSGSDATVVAVFFLVAFWQKLRRRHQYRLLAGASLQSEVFFVPRWARRIDFCAFLYDPRLRVLLRYLLARFWNRLRWCRLCRFLCCHDARRRRPRRDFRHRARRAASVIAFLPAWVTYAMQTWSAIEKSFL